MNAANWFGVRCLLRSCPFRPDSLGAYCTLGSCHRRELALPQPQHTIDELVATLPIKPVNSQE